MKGKSICGKLGVFVLVPLFILSLISVPATSVSAKVTEPSANLKPEKISVSSLNGSVSKTYTSPGSDKLVIHVQDAHCNPGVQNNIAAMLEDIHAKHDVDLIGIEDTGRWKSTAYISAIPDETIKQNVVKELIDKCYINGATKFVASQDKVGAMLFGVEDKDLYRESFMLYAEAAKTRESALKQAELVKDALDALKPHMLNEKLAEFAEKKSSFNNSEISFSDYVSYLINIAGSEAISLTTYPNLSIVEKTSKLEAEIDFDAVDSERTALVDALSSSLPKEKIEVLVENSIKFKTGKMEAIDYYTFLSNLAPKDKSYPNLTKYTQYVKTNAKLDKDALFKEKDSLESTIVDFLAKSPEERKLLALIDETELTDQLFSVKLTRDEFSRLAGSLTSIQEILAFIRENTSKYNVEFAWDKVDSNSWDACSKASISFYNNALAREDYFISNLLAQMETDKLNTAVLVTGGFHSDKITELLEAKGVSYVVVRPNVTERAVEGVYDNLMLNTVKTLSLNTRDPGATPEQRAGVAAGATGADPSALAAGIEGVDAKVGEEPKLPGAQGAETKIRDDFRLAFYGNVGQTIDSNSAFQDALKELWEAVSNNIPAGATLTPAAKNYGGVACLRTTAEGSFLTPSEQSLRLLAAKVAKGGLNQTIATRFIGQVVMAHEGIHRADINRPQGQAPKTEAQVVAEEIMILRKTFNDAELEDLAKAIGEQQNLGTDITYTPDVAYAAMLRGIIGKDENTLKTVNPATGKTLAMTLAEANVKAHTDVNNLAKELEPIRSALTDTNRLRIDAAGLGEAVVIDSNGKEIARVLLTEGTAEAIANYYASVNAIASVPIATLISAITATISSPAEIGGYSVIATARGIRTEVKPRLLVEPAIPNSAKPYVQGLANLAAEVSNTTNTYVIEVDAGLLPQVITTTTQQNVDATISMVKNLAKVKGQNQQQVYYFRFVNNQGAPVTETSLPEALRALQTTTAPSTVTRTVRYVNTPNTPVTAANTCYVPVSSGAVVTDAGLYVAASVATTGNYTALEAQARTTFDAMYNLADQRPSAYATPAAAAEAIISTPWTVHSWITQIFRGMHLYIPRTDEAAVAHVFTRVSA